MSPCYLCLYPVPLQSKSHSSLSVCFASYFLCPYTKIPFLKTLDFFQHIKLSVCCFFNLLFFHLHVSYTALHTYQNIDIYTHIYILLLLTIINDLAIIVLTTSQSTDICFHVLLL